MSLGYPSDLLATAFFLHPVTFTWQMYADVPGMLPALCTSLLPLLCLPHLTTAVGATPTSGPEPSEPEPDLGGASAPIQWGLGSPRLDPWLGSSCLALLVYP